MTVYEAVRLMVSRSARRVLRSLFEMASSKPVFEIAMGVVTPLREAWMGVTAPEESTVGDSRYSLGDSRMLENESACRCRGAGWLAALLLLLLLLDRKKFQADEEEALLAEVPEEVPGLGAGLFAYDEPLSEALLSPPPAARRGDWPITRSLGLLWYLLLPPEESGLMKLLALPLPVPADEPPPPPPPPPPALLLLELNRGKWKAPPVAVAVFVEAAVVVAEACMCVVATGGEVP